MKEYFIIGFISIIVVGLMEVVKKFLPENTNAKVTSIISLALGILIPIGYGFVAETKPAFRDIIKYIVSVVGLTQTSYNFIFKLFNALIEKLKSNISKELIKK